jgi:hypothetical protein
VNLAQEFQIDGLEKGHEYRFRYRVVNKVGVSDWSPESVLIPAVVPSAPPKPKFVSADSTSISIEMFRSQDTGGLKILNYKLEMKQDGLYQ